MTDEQGFIQRRLLELGIECSFGRYLCEIGADAIRTRCAYGGATVEHPYANLLLVTGREPVDDLWQKFETAAARVGDCLVPSSIADAVYSGHRFAREFGEDPPPPRRERVLLSRDSR